MGVEKAIDRPIFESAVLHAAQGGRAPLSLLTLSNAIYYQAVREYRSMYVEATSACEILLLNEVVGGAESLGGDRARVRRAIRKLKFEDAIGRGIENALGRSFANEMREAYDWLLALWVGRGNVAHGKAEVIVHKGERRTPQSSDRTSMMKAVIKLFMWIQQFRPFSVDYAAR